MFLNRDSAVKSRTAKKRHMAVNYYSEAAPDPPVRRRELTAWIKQEAPSHGKKCGEVSNIFCADGKILEVNEEYLQHDYYTDIITFDYTEGNTISGDIFISLDTVSSNADKFAQPYSRELLRVVIHGILHLCGINDKGEGEREIMEQAENNALALIDIPSLYKKEV